MTEIQDSPPHPFPVPHPVFLFGLFSRCILYNKLVNETVFLSSVSCSSKPEEEVVRTSVYSWLVRGEAGTCEWPLKLGQFCGMSFEPGMVCH